MWNTRLDEAEAGIKIAGRYINSFRYSDDTILIAENEEKLKSLLMRVKGESEKSGLKHNNKETNETLLLNHKRRWDSWHPEEKNSIWGQRRGLNAQSFCVIKFY